MSCGPVAAACEREVALFDPAVAWVRMRAMAAPQVRQ